MLGNKLLTVLRAACSPRASDQLTNSCEPADSQWHVNGVSFSGRDGIIKFLTDKWDKELDYRLEKTLWWASLHPLVMGG